ncbi:MULTISPECIES: hypothetical protein [Hymenobacter]|uniref:Uncharacterized protein n=1 Tax=Hymenobacter mucosus TaxID=1411120 RepID=A0A239B3T7_9BACT|nr:MULTISPECIES: hypothetical protein [Hymenobacter]SNS01888.1 hypothetical protein SAMN06269173_11743 [Hymenobacter mucosus]
MHGLRKIEQLFSYDALVQLANEVRKQDAGYRSAGNQPMQDNVPFGPHILQLGEQGHPRFFGVNSENEPQLISLPFTQPSQFTSFGYSISSEAGTFRLHRTTLALWVASLSFSQLKQHYPRIFEANNASTMVLTPPHEFGVIITAETPWGQLYTDPEAYADELKQVAAKTGVVITHNEQEDLFGLYHRGALVGQAARLDTEQFVRLLTYHLNTPVAYQPVKQKVLNERYGSAFPAELDNFDNWDGEVREHQQFPLANLYYVRVQAATEKAALNMAREEIALQRTLNPIRVAARGLPFEIESVVMLDRLSNSGFYEVRYHFVTADQPQLASAS